MALPISRPKTKKFGSPAGSARRARSPSATAAASTRRTWPRSPSPRSAPNGVLAIIGRSASYPESQWANARQVAVAIGLDVVEVDTDELNDPRYAANPSNRCYFCKTELWSRLVPLARDAWHRRRRRRNQRRRPHAGTGPVRKPRESTVSCRRSRCSNSRKRRFAPARARSACRPGSSRRRPACRREFRTALR